MNEEREYILAKDGIELSVVHWPVQNTKAVCSLIHGLGEHVMRYAPLAEFLNDQGIAVFGLDLRGHGHSQGKRGHARSYEALMSDIEEFLKCTREEYLDLPIFLIGHSLGGNLVAHYVKTQNTSELTGFVLSSPFFRVNFEPPKWKMKMANMLESIWPSLTQPSDLDVNALSRMPEEVQKYREDPLVHDQISIALFLSSTKKGQEVLLNTSRLSIPGLLYHGSQDRITSYDASLEFHRRNQNLKFVSIENAFHEPHNDLCRDEVFKMVSEFILDES